MTSAVIPRDTIETIVSHRDRAVELYEAAFEQIRLADEALARARGAVDAACGGKRPDAYVSGQIPEIEAFRSAVKLPDVAQFMRVARRLTDMQVWGALIERTDMDHLMDKQEKDRLRTQMAYIPEKVDRSTGELINADEIARGLPPVTADAVEATLRGLVEESGTIFRRGIANAFAGLDRRFRSHDGFKVGSRMILSYAFDGWGNWNWNRNHRDTLTDVERVFLVLDGKSPRAAYAGIVGKVEAVRRESGSGPRQDVIEGDYFRVRIFQNGNAHLWFTRKDLVVKVNRILAEWYGEVLGEGKDRAPDPNAPLQERALTHARNFGFFPTPPEVVDRILRDTPSYVHEGDRPLRILEPSAGEGAISARLAAVQTSSAWREGREHGRSWRNRVDVVEVQADLAAKLEASGLYERVLCRDFLEMKPDPSRLYDVVAMNPPFDRQRDIDHVSHALTFVKPGGYLVAIMSAGVEFRENAKAQAFRALVKHHGGHFFDLPAGSFSATGTNVNTCYVEIRRTKES